MNGLEDGKHIRVGAGQEEQNHFPSCPANNRERRSLGPAVSAEGTALSDTCLTC